VSNSVASARLLSSEDGRKRNSNNKRTEPVKTSLKIKYII
jgi:hypothetical protein